MRTLCGGTERTTETIVHNLTTGKTECTYTVDGENSEESFCLKSRDKEGTGLASLSLFGIGELTVITDTTGYLTITTYSQPADDNCYLYHYRYSDNVVVLTPVNYDTGFIFSTLAADDDNTIILHIGKTGEDERYSLHFVK